jgi:hypothetical protein
MPPPTGVCACVRACACVCVCVYFDEHRLYEDGQQIL